MRACGLKVGLRNQNKRHAERGGHRGESVLVTFELGRGDEVECPRREAGASECIGNHGADVVRRRAFAATDARDDHGFSHTHWVTGSAGRQACMPPMGSTRAIATRVSSPPSVARRAKSSASVSTVTALTTNRPPGRSAAAAAASAPAAPPPMPPRRECGKRHGANLALGDLAVVLEKFVGQTGRSCEHARARRGLDLDRNHVERSHVAEVEARGRRHTQAFARTAQRLEHGHARGAEAGIGQQAGERSRPLAI